MLESKVCTRPAGPGDLEHMFDCYRRTMREHVEAAWGWDDVFQREGFGRAIATANCVVIEVEGHFAGFLWLQATVLGTMLRLVCIEPHYQGAGIGSHMIKATVDQHPSLRIKVFKSNRAVDLYRRMGFCKIGQDEHMWEMVHRTKEALS
jgi:ribosomal protein S18 acetylase RimI-like enzyme